MTAESSSDMLVVPREPAGNTPGGDDNTGKATSAGGTTRTRKKVTFDLDLQVRTIPQRIPVYERRPAYNNSGHLIPGRSAGQSFAFVPRPLDIRTRDRYLIGAANLSAKRIIDLFSVPNGYPNYPLPPKGRQGHSGWKRQPPGYGGTASGKTPPRHPAYTFNNGNTTTTTSPVKMSRAAANLKQITAALGEHFDSSVYQEWDSTSTSSPTSHGNGRSSVASQRGKDSPETDVVSCTTVSLTPPQSFTPTTTTKMRPNLAYRHRLNPKHASSTDSNRVPSAGSTRSTSGPTRKLPAVVSGQSSFGDSQLIISKAPSNQRIESRRRSDAGYDRDRVDRSSSRCSTIDTYVISEHGEGERDGVAASTSSRTSGQRIGSGRHMTPTPPGATRSFAWEGGETIPVAEPALGANALRTSKPRQSFYGSGSTVGQSDWQVSSRSYNR